jgi:hypothetical protein
MSGKSLQTTLVEQEQVSGNVGIKEAQPRSSASVNEAMFAS